MRLWMLVIAMLASSSALAQTHQTVSIKMVRTGWNADQFAIVPVEPVQNPASCPSPDGYLSEKSQPGYSTFLAATLTAFTNTRPVTVVIDNGQCAGGRPKIAGINLSK